MASAEQGILDRFEVLVGTGTGRPDGLSTHRFPNRQVHASECPLAVIYPVAAPKPQLAELGGTVQRTMRVRVRLHAGGPGDTPERDADPPDVLVDPLYVWTVQRVMAAGAFVAQGVFDEDGIAEADSVWDSDATRDLEVGQRTVDFEVTYYTNQRDPETVV